MAQKYTPEELLECTICLDVPASPIHNCSNGHIICGICKDKVTKCGLCESKQLEVSVALERLSRQIGFRTRCPNYESGCRKPIAATEVKDHDKICYYRNVMCPEKDTQICNLSVPICNVVRHLKEKVHPIMGTDRKLIVDNNGPSLHLDGVSWPLGIATKSGQWFLMHSYISKGVAYFWTTVLGDKEESLKHMFQLTLEPLPGNMGRTDFLSLDSSCDSISRLPNI